MRTFEYNTINNMSFDVAKSIYNFYNYYTKKQGYFSLVLSGGNTPRLLYEILSSEYKERIDWKKVFLFFGDERYVDKEDKYSNYKMAFDSLISKIPIPPKNVFRVKTEIEPIEKCAEEYENAILNFFKSKNKDVSFDLILLGIGNDGHTASIFPDTTVSKDKYIDYVFPQNATQNVPRITFTYKAINNSKNVIFILSGKNKINILKKLFKEKKYPASHVNPEENLLFFVSKI